MRQRTAQIHYVQSRFTGLYFNCSYLFIKQHLKSLTSKPESGGV